jgi:hypothetical protein
MSKLKYHEGPIAKNTFEQTMITLFRTPKTVVTAKKSAKKAKKGKD